MLQSYNKNRSLIYFVIREFLLKVSRSLKSCSIRALLIDSHKCQVTTASTAALIWGSMALCKSNPALPTPLQFPIN